MKKVSFALPAACYVNDQIIPCGEWLSKYGLLMAIVFIFVGLFTLFGTNLIFKIQVWWMKILGAKYDPGKIMPKILKGIGLIFLLCGLIFLYLAFFH